MTHNDIDNDGIAVAMITSGELKSVKKMVTKTGLVICDPVKKIPSMMKTMMVFVGQMIIAQIFQCKPRQCRR